MDVRTAAIEILSKSQDSVSDDVVNYYMSKLSSLEERADLKNIIQSVLEKGKYAGRDYKSPTDIANNARRKAGNIEGGSQTGISAMPHVKQYGGSGASAASRTAKKMKQLSSKNHVHIKNGEGAVVDVVHASGRKKGKTVFKDDAEKKAHLAELNKSAIDRLQDILKKAQESLSKGTSNDNIKQVLIDHHLKGKKTGIRALDTHLADARGEKRMATGEEMAQLKKPKNKKPIQTEADRFAKLPKRAKEKEVARRIKGAKTLGQLSGVQGTGGEQKAASEDKPDLSVKHTSKPAKGSIKRWNEQNRKFQEKNKQKLPGKKDLEYPSQKVQLKGLGEMTDVKAASEDNVQSLAGHKKKKEVKARLDEHKANQAEHKDIRTQIEHAMRVGMDEHGNIPQPSKPKLKLVKEESNDVNTANTNSAPGKSLADENLKVGDKIQHTGIKSGPPDWDSAYKEECSFSKSGQWSLNKVSEKMNVVEGKDDKNNNPHGASEAVNRIGGREDQIN